MSTYYKKILELLEQSDIEKAQRSINAYVYLHFEERKREEWIVVNVSNVGKIFREMQQKIKNSNREYMNSIDRGYLNMYPNDPVIHTRKKKIK